MPIISIIIPNFNSAQWLSTCIESCLQQTGNFQMEIIVVDDQSSDNSWEVLQAFQLAHPKEVFIYRNPDKGANAARNYGFTKSRGEFIQWLDSDDYLLPDKFRNQLDFLKTKPSLDIVYSDWRMDFFEDGKKVKEEFHSAADSEDYLLDLLLNKWQANSSYLIKREVAEKLHQENGWNEETKIGQDREYFTLAAIHGSQFGYKSGVYSVYNRWSSNSISNKLSYKRNIENSILLNSLFYTQIKNQITNNRRYLKVLNAELLSALFYYPTIKLPRFISIFRINSGHWHWKKRITIPILYLWHLFRI